MDEHVTKWRDAFDKHFEAETHRAELGYIFKEVSFQE